MISSTVLLVVLFVLVFTLVLLVLERDRYKALYEANKPPTDLADYDIDEEQPVL